MPKKQTARTPSARATRARKVAQAAAEGKTGAEIARETGASLRTVRRDLRSVPVEQVIVGLVAAHEERITALFSQSLDAIERGLSAGRSTIVTEKRKDGATQTRVVDLGPDPYAQLTAARALVGMLTAGRGASKPAVADPRGFSISWPEYERLWAEKQADLAAGKKAA